MLPGRIALRIIFLGAQKDSKSNLRDILLYIKVIASYSFKVESAIKKKEFEFCFVFAAILKLPKMHCENKTLYFDVFFSIRYTLI